MISTTHFLPTTPNSNASYIQEWIERIAEKHTQIKQPQIIKACQWAEEIHQSQTHVSGKPFLMHVITVADILAQLGMDTDVLVAAILHNIASNKQVILSDVERRFGQVVANLVDGVTKMGFIEELNDKSQHTMNTKKQIEQLRKMLLAMSKDIRVVLIKLADRLDRMRFLHHQPEDKQKRFARETLELFAPLANRLGIWQIKWELEDLSLRYLEPETYKRIASFLDERRIDREQYIQKLLDSLSKALRKNNISSEITGRPKHIYSIWRKMQRKGLDFEQIFDVRALRVLVNSVTECYTALGIIHNIWQPLPNEFDDYIANPKANNYQSLHTAVIGHEQKIFEVQIRTHKMHHHSELGVASHWLYKEGKTQQDKSFEQKIQSLRKILQFKDQDDDIGDFIDRFKSEIFEDQVYVLSPQSKIVNLVQGSTPLDFAYYIHTELGHRCRGAMINQRIVPLTYMLKNGDVVNILTSKEAKPSRDWLIKPAGYLCTRQARNKVKQWFKKQDIQKNISEGKTLLERLLRRLNIKNTDLEHLAQQLAFDSVGNLFASIGRGDTTTMQVSGVFNEQVLSPKKTQVKSVKVNKLEQFKEGVYIEGVGGLLVQMAQCCQPNPKQQIVGYITRGRGVTIHYRDCPNALRWQDEGNERLVEVSWGMPDKPKILNYPITIQLKAIDRVGLLRDVCMIIATAKVNIISTNSAINQQDNSVFMELNIEIKELEQLNQTLSKLDNLANVSKVWRKNT
ncbi:MAG: bifunctional (p)ppGpp synthetase/guanosine-3',5'-bis(diphosphate) 3'-pyrophosphohydrolase [Thiomargarita sp.]|nr:bifunctional (p)ppGpp synthetase/guanosine-3',5'-bis(diphosphate) 3'-pyrophosphohydrolase [Thiomargarita sp.]